MASWQQHERQRARSRDGRYNKLNPCEMCGKSVGADYCSVGDENEFDGRGLVLHAKCLARLESFPKAEQAAMLIAAAEKKQRG
jgi:hypothetical protein